MYQIIKRAQWFTSGVLLTAVATGLYVYGLPFISKVKFQWWVWTAELSDVLKLGI
jgi:hypothetical protein